MMTTMTTVERRSDEARPTRGSGVRTARRSRSLLAAALVLGLAAAGAAEAARFGVRVVDERGQPVAGASVCIGLEGNYGQFGTLFTDADGQADLVEVPNVPFVVTVSKTRFTGLRRGEPARSYDLVRQITLAEGQPGPRCKAGSTLADGPSLIDVRHVDVETDATSTRLVPRVSGEPGEYRIAGDGDIEGAPWQRFERSIAVPASLADAPAVYLQLRRYEGSRKSWIEARSNVVTVDLPGRDL